jgi:hypothetical protein
MRRVHVPKFNDQNGFKVLGDTIKRTEDTQKLNEGDQTGLKLEGN